MRSINGKEKVRSNAVFWRGANIENPANCPDGIREIVIYCNETFGKDNWDIIGGTLYFLNEADAIMFKLKYGYR